MKLYIKNMACESCKIVVREALEKLKLHPVKVELGVAEIKEKIKADKKEKLNSEINKAGLELVENKSSILIEQIKSYIQKYVNSADKPTVNLSDYLSDNLKYEYNYLSNVFSEIEATTISYYMNALKMERAKEYILFEDLTLTEIAERLHYASLSSFSAQFKKFTDLSPSHFKKVKEKRISIQNLNGHN